MTGGGRRDGLGGAMGRDVGFFKRIWLTRFSKPVGERTILQAVGAVPVRADGTLRILELGLGTLRRADRLLRLAGARRPKPAVHYVGLDRFEARLPADPPGVTL
jgi:hypothetical protein